MKKTVKKRAIIMLIGTLGSTENKSPFKILMLVLFVLIEFIFMYKSKPAFTTDDFSDRIHACLLFK